MKSIIRFIISMLKRMEKKLLKAYSMADLHSMLLEEPFKFDSKDESEIFNDLVNINLNKSNLASFDAKNSEHISKKLSKMTKFNFTYTRPKIEDFSEIIKSKHELEILHSWLPLKQKMQTMYQVFSTKNNGYNLSTLYKNISDLGSSILLLVCATKIEGESNKEMLKKNQKEKSIDNLFVFGVFMNESFQPLSSYQGSANSFLFSLKPNENVYRWTKKNDCFVMGKEDSLMFGGGVDGKTGLYLDDELLMGSSDRCQTFDNDPLCESTSFMIFKIEVYSFK
jgi:hypothetical protein